MATTVDFQIPKPPSLVDLMADSKVVTQEVAYRYDQKMERWRQDLQRNIIDRFQPKASN